MSERVVGEASYDEVFEYSSMSLMIGTVEEKVLGGFWTQRQLNRSFYSTAMRLRKVRNRQY